MNVDPQRLSRWTWLTLGAILALGFGLRAGRLGEHFFWYDEALILNSVELPKPAIEYTAKVWNETTYNPGWPLIVWSFVHAARDRLSIARLPSCLTGTLAIAAVFWAARALRLDRGTALLAALLTALSWTQIEYSQQVLPYAVVPLLSAVCVALLGYIDRVAPERVPWRFLGLHAALLTACAIYLAIHNSFLLFLPVLPLALALGLVRPLGRAQRAEREGSSVRSPLPAPRSPVFRVACAGAVLPSVLLLAVFFYLPKRGEGFRDYLAGFYLPTFRSAPPSLKFYLNQLDDWYRSHVSAGLSPWRDAPYFLSTRTLDLLIANLNPRFSLDAEPIQVAAAGPLIVAFGIGAVQLLRGRQGRTARILTIGAIGAAGLGFVLSALAMYPYGGVRQMLPLAPLFAIVAAAGAREVFRWFPRWAGTLTVGMVLLSLSSVPSYHGATRTILSENVLRALMRRAGAKTIVAGDCWWSFGPLMYLGRHLPETTVVEPPYPEYARLIYSKQPFLLVSMKAPVLERTATGWQICGAFRRYCPGGFDIGHYRVEPLLESTARNVGLPIFAYAVRPIGPAP